MKKIITLLIVIILIGSSLIFAFAHSGRTDSNGGHYNRSTEEYHYHHGYSAHQHVNGVCPYDFDDKTGSSSGSSSDLLSAETYRKYWQDAKEEISELEEELAEENNKSKKFEKQLSELKETLSEYEFILIASVITVSVIIFIAIKNKNKYDKTTGRELAEYKKEIKALQKTNNEISARLLSAENKLRKKEKTILELRSATNNPKLLSDSSVYIGTAIVDTNLNSLCKTYTEYVGERYREKGYTVATISNNNKLEKYLKATKPGKCLLIQCVYTVTSPTINEASVVALYSTFIRLNNNYLSNTTPVLITNALLTDEAKDFAEQLNITYKENYVM